MEAQDISLVYRLQYVVQVVRVHGRLLQHHLVVILQHVTQRGDAQCREHPLRHVSPSILVPPDVVAVSIGLVTFYLYAEDGVYLIPVAVERADAQLRMVGVAGRHLPFVNNLLQRHAPALQLADEPTIKLGAVVHGED